MKINNKKHINENIVLRDFFIFILLAMILTPLIFLSKEKSYYDNDDEIDIVKNLRISFNNEGEKITDLNKYKLPKIKKGDSLTISYNMPKLDIDNPVLILESYHSVVNIYVDDKMIYQYGVELQQEDKNVGHVYLHIPILHEYEGKNFKIEYHYTEDDSLSYLYNMKICSEGSSYLKLINKNILQILLISTTLLIGVIGLIFSVSRRRYTREYLKMSYISAFSILSAIWVMCSSKVVFLIFRNASVINMLEYYSLYSVSIPLSLYFSEMNYNKVKSRTLKILALLQFFVVIFTVFNYHVLKINYSSFLPVFHMFLLIEFIAMLNSLRNMPKKRKSEKIVLIGVTIMCVFGVIDLVKFNLNRYQLVDKIVDTSLLPIGVAIFVFGELYSFYVERINNIFDEKEKKILSNLAFIDVLTGINNRTKCELLFDEYEKKYESIIIGSFDIDNFKYINDTLGHTIGDKAIKAIAILLKEAFSSFGEVGRMGGDEFIVITPENNIKKFKTALDYFLNLLEDYNKSDEIELELSISYGYSSRVSRDEKNIMKVYEESDKKMYICKNDKKYIINNKF